MPGGAQVAELSPWCLQIRIWGGAEVAVVTLSTHVVVLHGSRGHLITDVTFTAGLGLSGKVINADLVTLASSGVELVISHANGPLLSALNEAALALGMQLETGVGEATKILIEDGALDQVVPTLVVLSGSVDDVIDPWVEHLVQQLDAGGAVVGGLEDPRVGQVDVDSTLAVEVPQGRIVPLCGRRLSVHLVVLARRAVSLVAVASLDVVLGTVVVADPLVENRAESHVVPVALGRQAGLLLIEQTVTTTTAEVGASAQDINVGRNELSEEELLVVGVHGSLGVPVVLLQALEEREARGHIIVGVLVLGHRQPVEVHDGLERLWQIVSAARLGHPLNGAHNARGTPRALAHLPHLPILAPSSLGARGAGEAVLREGAAVRSRGTNFGLEKSVNFTCCSGRTGVAFLGLNRGSVVPRKTRCCLDSSLTGGKVSLGGWNGVGSTSGAQESSRAQATALGIYARRLAVETLRARLRIGKVSQSDLGRPDPSQAITSRGARIRPQSRVVTERITGDGSVGTEESCGAHCVGRSELLPATSVTLRTDGGQKPSKRRADVASWALGALNLASHGIKEARRTRQRVPVPVTRAVSTNRARNLLRERTVETSRALSRAQGIDTALRAVHALRTGLGCGIVVYVAGIDGGSCLAVHASRTRYWPPQGKGLTAVVEANIGHAHVVGVLQLDAGIVKAKPASDGLEGRVVTKRQQMPLGPDPGRHVRDLDTEIGRVVVPAGGIASSEKELKALGPPSLPDGGGPLRLRQTREELRAEERVSAGSCRGGGSLKAEVSLGTRLLGNLNSCHIADKACWADPWHMQTLLGAHVANRAAQTAVLLLEGLVGSTRAQGEVLGTGVGAECTPRALQLRQIIVTGVVGALLDVLSVLENIPVGGEIFSVVGDLDVDLIWRRAIGADFVVYAVREVGTIPYFPVARVAVF
mmetsp:Transcript_26061/g.49208  ORF Transcript_26061/g.49208 Transcript_26061/m.49208 type:complete len:931 (+) Transcript_26061:4841-7633(+)